MMDQWWLFSTLSKSCLCSFCFNILFYIQQLDHLQVHAATATAQSPVKVKAEVIKDGFVTYVVKFFL